MFEPCVLRQSSIQKEGVLHTSKPLKLPLLIDQDEMKALFSHLDNEFPSWGLFYVQGICQLEEGKIIKEYFLARYNDYLNFLKKGENPPIEEFRGLFSAIITQTVDVIYSMKIGEHRHMIKAIKPIVQLQPHAVHYSKEDHEFRSMVFGEDSLSWGIQFSYPQLYQNADHEIYSVNESSEFPNTAVFKSIQKWVRYHTVATPFIVDEKKVNVPIRLGKRCFSWINHHPKLEAQIIKIAPYVSKTSS